MLGDALDITLICRRLDYRFSLAGLLLWLVLIIVISLVASRASDHPRDADV